MVTITVQPEYGYVVMSAVGTCFLGFWHGARCSAFRKQAGLGYPTPYADSAMLSSASAESKHNLYLFNCAQRAHGNFLENHTSVVISMLIAGLRYPLATSILALIWSLGRIVYAVGYTAKNKENGKGRLAGAFFWFAQLGLYGMAATTGYKIAF